MRGKPETFSRRAATQSNQDTRAPEHPIAQDIQPLSAGEFEQRYHALATSLTAGDNQDCVECRQCRACARSTFCRHSERLVGCHYCNECDNCTDCSHCRGSSRLVGCHHCVLSQDCTSSSYLIRCEALSNCNYCFGCVGLSGKDFHILNEPYNRQDYFELTRRLRSELRLPR